MKLEARLIGDKSNRGSIHKSSTLVLESLREIVVGVG